MRKVKSLWLVALSVLLVVSIAIFTAACDKPKVTITVQPVSAEVEIGKTITLTAEGGTAYTWSSDNTEVATVDNNGVVTGVALGSANIKVASDGGEATCAVQVIRSSIVPVIDIDDSERTLKVGATYTLEPKLMAGGTEVSYEFAFASSDSAIATVSDSGVITAVKAGAASISISYSYNGYSDSVAVPVRIINDVIIELDKNVVDLVVKKAAGSTNLTSDTVTVTTLKENGADCSADGVVWESEDPTIATVSDGVITAVKAGVVKIKAKYNFKTEGEVVSEVTVNVGRETITESYPAAVDLSWDYGYENEGDVTYIIFPSQSLIEEDKIEAIYNADGQIISENNGTEIPKSSLAIGNNEIVVYTSDFIYEADVNVTSSCYALQSYGDQFKDGVGTVSVVDFAGKTNVAKLSVQYVAGGDIWNGRVGYMRLKDYYTMGYGGCYLFSLYAEEGNLPGGYSYPRNSTTSASEDIANYLNTSTMKFDGDWKVVDENMQETTFKFGEWNTIMVDMESNKDVYDYMELVLSFCNRDDSVNTPGDELTMYLADFKIIASNKYNEIMNDKEGNAVTFETLIDGKTIPDQYVIYNQKVTEPSLDTGEYTLLGWYDGERKWDFDKDKVYGPVTLTALYEGSATVTVKHYIESGSGNYTLYQTDTQTAEYGTRVTATPLTIEGYTYDADSSREVQSVMVTVGDEFTLMVYYSLNSLPEGVDKYAINSLSFYNNTTEATVSMSVYEGRTAWRYHLPSGGTSCDARKLYTVNDNCPSLVQGNYFAIEFVWDGNPGGMMSYLNGGLVTLSVYDADNNLVEGDLEAGVWYKAVGKVEIREDNKFVFTAGDWITDSSVYFGNIYTFTESAYNSIFNAVAA